jgi:YHS domain-containing protein
MRKVSVVVSALIVLAISVAAFATDGETKKNLTNKKCPVMNSAASEKFRTEYKNQYVYFCCQGCIKMFEKDPDGYVAKLSKEDQEAIKANEVCPITDDKIADHTRWVEHEGRKVYLCCDGCVQMFKQKIALEKKTD